MNLGSHPKVFHRAPRAIDPDPERPQREPNPCEPTQSPSASWTTVISGIVTGVAVASVSGQWYFALFSIVTGFVSVLMWLTRLAQFRRRMKRWRSSIARIDTRFEEDCRRCARELADHRRFQHPTLKDVELEVRMGGNWFWHRRNLDLIALGRGRRGITVVEGALVAAFDDIPILVNLSPGELVGIHGRRVASALRALIVRMAAGVGPSDWRLGVLGDADGDWRSFERLPHHIPSIEFDLGSNTSRSVQGHLVVVVFDSSLLIRHTPVMRAFEDGSVTLIVVAAQQRDLPASCTSIIDADEDEVDGLGLVAFDDICRAIASWTDPDLESGGLPDEIGFFDLVADRDASVDSISEMWRNRRGLGPRLALGSDGEDIVHVDLDGDGPHAVIVGTTGSGKSEVLRLFVMSMAWHSSPSDVSFVLVDYKGGSAFDACSDLPHVAGVITDLDEGMAGRVLIGLESELKRRESVLREARAKDVIDLNRINSSSTGQTTLARLVVVIDELAALREDEPDFVPALAAIAQRGRSLGLHLVVATQRPAALTADVTGNSSLRIALRVQTPGDSLDLIGSDRAARIDRNHPGRLTLKVGGDEVRDVQAARVSDVLAELVDLVNSARIRGGFPLPNRPWTDPLPTIVTRGSDMPRGSIGMIDDLTRQKQEIWRFSGDCHVLICGGIGRTNALRAIALALGDDGGNVDIVIVTNRSSPADHVERFATWVDAADRERLERTIRLWEERNAASSADDSCDRRLVVLIDDVDTWFERSFGDRVGTRLWETFETLLATSSPSRVVCVMTAVREHGLPGSIAARVSAKWTGTRRPGVFDIDDGMGTSGVVAQFFWEPPSEAPTAPENSVLEQELAHLPTVVRSPREAFAVRAETRGPISVSPREPMRFMVVGSRGSGVSSALRALARSWIAANPRAQVVDLSSPLLLSGDIACRSSQWVDSVDQDEPTLIVVDDVHRNSRCDSNMTKILEDPSRWGSMSFIAGVSPVFVRSRPDHWIQNLRRVRTGVLLGRSIEEDCDLLGLHVPPLNVYVPSPGRGLWVDGGAAMGIIQFVITSPSDDDST